jgi:hypothetical protein
MAMIEAEHGGIKKLAAATQVDYLASLANAEINLNLNGTDTVVDHGGIVAAPSTQNYQGIEQVATPNVGVDAKYVPPLPSNLVVDHGGVTQPRTIVNDEQ